MKTKQKSMDNNRSGRGRDTRHSLRSTCAPPEYYRVCIRNSSQQVSGSDLITK
ncbi:uncharacterized protein PgNI_03393 [Pyricularia grisea]|uniref:Uncharacterized protein n=1 Tax=Pyricularia grisea TaxID=148305 RepID=A0A6P8BAR2_PYRGI|nr:uncharacterized protein PgNI_03393 [Pyricularia grisea]TLD12889.1 hypothetical protein PgNI_03393 [Pyricularia grisea]